MIFLLGGLILITISPLLNAEIRNALTGRKRQGGFKYPRASEERIKAPITRSDPRNSLARGATARIEGNVREEVKMTPKEIELCQLFVDLDEAEQVRFLMLFNSPKLEKFTALKIRRKGGGGPEVPPPEESKITMAVSAGGLKK